METLQKQVDILSNNVHHTIQALKNDDNNYVEKIPYGAFGGSIDEQEKTKELFTLLENNYNNYKFCIQYLKTKKQLLDEIQQTLEIIKNHNISSYQLEYAVGGSYFPTGCCDGSARNIMRQELAAGHTNTFLTYDKSNDHVMVGRSFWLQENSSCIFAIFDPTYEQNRLGYSKLVHIETSSNSQCIDMKDTIIGNYRCLHTHRKKWPLTETTSILNFLNETKKDYFSIL